MEQQVQELKCGCKAFFCNNKWFYEEYCEEHDPEETGSNFYQMKSKKVIKKFKVYDE